MKNDTQEILLTINLEAGTVLRKSIESKKVLSNVKLSTKLSQQFVDYAKTDKAGIQADIRKHDWKRLSAGQRLDKMIRTIVADQLALNPDRLVTNVNYVWDLID